jgi:hypothetical protein
MKEVEEEPPEGTCDCPRTYVLHLVETRHGHFTYRIEGSSSHVTTKVEGVIANPLTTRTRRLPDRSRYTLDALLVELARRWGAPKQEPHVIPEEGTK